MKDYLLSEIAKSCDDFCSDCEQCKEENRDIFHACMVTKGFSPSFYRDKIEQRDVIELPCIIPMGYLSAKYYVIYRDVFDRVQVEVFGLRRFAEDYLDKILNAKLENVKPQ